MRVSIIGSGVVGTATGTALVIDGHEVMFYDINSKAFLDIPIDQRNENWDVTLEFRKAYEFGEVLILCVPTEFVPKDQVTTYFKTIDRIRHLHDLYANENKIIVQKSTCPPLTARNMRHHLIYDMSSRYRIDYVVWPEFLNAGTPLKDMLTPRKVVIGLSSIDLTSRNNELRVKLAELLRFYDNDLVYYMTYEEAEFAKYANNILHASLISIWNELYVIADNVSRHNGVSAIDTDKIARITALEKGLESTYRFFGQAWGGACLPKDTREFARFTTEQGLHAEILEAVISINDLMREEYGVNSKHWDELHHPEDYQEQE